MKTKNIFKAVALAMMMPAMLLTTACSNDDDVANTSYITNKGYALPVTVNVTRQDDGATRASFDGSKLNFSAGDKLFVKGNHGTAGLFAGTLDYDAVSGKFSGTIYTKNSYDGTAAALFTSANTVRGTLLPNGYGSTGFLSINNNSTPDDATDDYVSTNFAKAIALTKNAAVEQLSWEQGNYSGSFLLQPRSAILNFTITGLAASTQVAVVFTSNNGTVNENVTTDALGNATFALGVSGGEGLHNCTLSVGGNPITLVSSSKTLTAGKIYNITRAAAPAPAAASLSELKTAINGGTDCSSYIGWEVNSAGAIAQSGISGTKIGYVAYVSTSDVDAGVSGSRILVIASADAAATTLTWGSQGTARGVEAVENANDLNGYSNTNTLQGYGSEAHPAACAAWNYSATIPSGGASPAHWFMPTKKQWENMLDAKGGAYIAMATAYGIEGNYWSSNEYFNGEDYSECKNWAWRLAPNSTIMNLMKSNALNVRSIFAY